MGCPFVRAVRENRTYRYLTYSLAFLSHGSVCVCLSVFVLRIPKCLRVSLLEPDHNVLPVTDMVAKFDSNHRWAGIIATKVSSVQVSHLNEMISECNLLIPGKVEDIGRICISLVNENRC